MWLSSTVEGDSTYSGLTMKYNVTGPVAMDLPVSYDVHRSRPPSLLPPNATGLELALEAAAASEPPAPIRALWDIDACPDELLPWLEWTLHTDWPGETADEKREIIRVSAEIHRKKGTLWAVKRVLAALRMDSTVSEWFEYGGEPYCFKVEIDISDRGIDEALFDTLMELIHEYKNIRSHLENLRLAARTRSEIRIGIVPLSGESVEIHPFAVTLADAPAFVARPAIGWQAWGTTSVYPLQ